MKVENIKIWEQGEYNYKTAYGFIPSIMFYLHEDEVKRPFMLILPGGAYLLCSEAEGDVVAEEFFNRGYNVGVLNYTINMIKTEPLKKQPLNDIGRAIRYIRKNSEKLNVIEDKVCVCGFSAGGHLSGWIAVHYDDTDERNEEYLKFSARPDAAILGYARTTFGEEFKSDSLRNIVAQDVYEAFDKYKKEIDYLCLEKHVNSSTPPCFIWHTATDNAVPVSDAYTFAQALQKVKVPYGLHIFSFGPHGLSVANDRWERRDFGEPYTLEQIVHTLNAVETGELVPTAEIKGILDMYKDIYKNCSDYSKERERAEAFPEVAIWVDVAERWLNKYLNL